MWDGLCRLRRGFTIPTFSSGLTHYLCHGLPYHLEGLIPEFHAAKTSLDPSTGSFGETPSFDEENGIDLDSMLLRHCWTDLRHDCIAIEVLGTECDLVHQDQSLSVVIH